MEQQMMIQHEDVLTRLLISKYETLLTERQTFLNSIPTEEEIRSQCQVLLDELHALYQAYDNFIDKTGKIPQIKNVTEIEDAYKHEFNRFKRKCDTIGVKLDVLWGSRERTTADAPATRNVIEEIENRITALKNDRVYLYSHRQQRVALLEYDDIKYEAEFKGLWRTLTFLELDIDMLNDDLKNAHTIEARLEIKMKIVHKKADIERCEERKSLVETHLSRINQYIRYGVWVFDDGYEPNDEI